MITDNGQMASRFLENTPNFEGQLERGEEQMCANTKARLSYENTMKGVAIQQKKSLDKIITNTLSSFPDALKAYIIAHGEVPIDGDPVKLSLQAIILRAKDVAKGASSIDTTDDDALMNIEQSEQGAQSDNTPDNETVLPIDMQAAMKIAMDYISDCHVEIGGDGSLSSALKDMDAYAVTKGFIVGSSLQPDNADGLNPADFGMDLGGDYIPASASLPGLASIPQSGGTTINPQTGMPNITANSAPNTNTSGIVNSSSNDSGIFGAISSILSGISGIAGQVTNTAGAINNANAAVKGTINNVGTSVFQNYLQQNKTQIIMIIIAIALFFFIVIYAAKKAK